MLLKLNLARNSLRYIIRTYEIKQLYIPYYICSNMRTAVIKEGCKPLLYHIDNDFLPIQQFEKDAYILYPNYFGICDKNVDFLVKKYPKMIIDNAHSYYSQPKGFASFNSARKFLPVYNGSYLWIEKISFIPEIQNSDLKYSIKNENDFDKLEIKTITKDLEDYIKSFNDKEARKQKFTQLHQKYGERNELNINESESPFCYPYLAESGEKADKLAEELTNKGLKIYRYWNNMPKSFNEYKFYRRLVPIPLT